MKKINPINFTGLSFKKTKSMATDNLLNTLVILLSNAYGDENISIVGNKELSIAIGKRKGSDGTKKEVCVNIKLAAQNPDDKKTKKYLYEYYDRDVEEAIHQDIITFNKRTKEEEENKRILPNASARFGATASEEFPTTFDLDRLTFYEEYTNPLFDYDDEEDDDEDDDYDEEYTNPFFDDDEEDDDDNE